MATHLTIVPVRQAMAASTGPVDTNNAKSNATAGFMALHIVTVGAQSVANTNLEPIPPVQTDDPDLQKQMKDVADKFADLQTKLGNAQVTAKFWLPQESNVDSGLCSTLSSIIPHHLLDYGATYSAVSSQIISLLDEAENSGSSSKLVGEALDLIGVLLTQVQGYRTEMDAAAQRLKEYVTKVQGDHNALVGGADAIQTLIGIDQTDADNLNRDIDHLHAEIDALNKQIMDAEIGVGVSIFVAVVGIVLVASGAGAWAGGVTIGAGVAGLAGSAAAWGVLASKVRSDQSKIVSEQATRDALTQQGIALTGLHGVVANLVNQLTAAQSALSDVSTFWQTFEETLQSVIGDLKKPNPDLKIVLDKVWVQSAQNNWNDLVEFAKNLLGVTVSVEFRPALSAGAAA